MDDYVDFPAQTALRPPGQVMRLARMGAMFPTRLSFLRSLLRRLAAENGRVERPLWNIDDKGFGEAVYSVSLSGRTYSLVALSNELPDDQRTDRVIATAWDTAYVLYDGIPTASEVARLAATAPRQEAARFTERDLVLSRANKSVRLFTHAVERLRNGMQPDAAMIRDVGYLMRTTAVYGNGKFGIADRSIVAKRPGLDGPFAAEMLTVWLIRGFTHDLVEHLGQRKLDRSLKRHLGVGNSTGLGMAPFLVSHPALLNNWMLARETALARVRALPHLTDVQRSRLRELADRAACHLSEWTVPDADHQTRIDALRGDWPKVRLRLDDDALRGPKPLDALMRWVEGESLDLQELTVALVLEPFDDVVDPLSDGMSDAFGLSRSIVNDTDALRDRIETHFAWALAMDFDLPSQKKQFWYVSEEKQEPRLGDRFAEPGAELETPLDIARRVKALYRSLPRTTQSLNTFRAAHLTHELALTRVLAAEHHPYAEIQDNLIAETCLPIDMLRCKLAFFGASKFDPKSDRWTRITLAQGAPLADELSQDDADDWWLPICPT